MTTLAMSGTVTTGGAGAIVNLDAFGITAFDLTDSMLRLTLEIDDVSRIGDLVFFVGTSSLVNNIKWRFDAATAVSRLGKDGERFQVGLQWCEINTVAGSINLSASGVPSVTSGFTDARLQVSDDATGPITVVLHKVEIVPRHAGVVSIVFDDTEASMVTFAAPRMAMLGMAGTAYTIVDLLGTAGRADLTTLRALAAAGWEVGGHAYAAASHDGANGYGSLTATAVRADLAALRHWLDAHFANGIYSFAYPKGVYEDTTDGVAIETLVAEAGFATGRTILSSVGVSTHVQVSPLPPALRTPMFYRLHAMSGISELAAGTSQFHPVNLMATGGMIDRVAATGGWLILVFHRIVAGTPSATTEINDDDFNDILSVIADKGVSVQTVRSVIAG